MASSKRSEPANAAPAQPPEASTGGDGRRAKPVHSIRIRNIRGAIWANDSTKGVWYNVTFARMYRDVDGEWNSSESFSRDDLLTLAKVADQCHTWITDTLQEKEAP